MEFITVVKQVGMLAAIMLMGFLVVKTGYVEARHKDSISKLIVKLILPCLIISSISKENFEPSRLGELGLVCLLSVICIGTLFGIGVITGKLLKVPRATEAVHQLMACLGNVIFMGYPIIVAMYGNEGFFYAIIYWLLNDLFMWTVGVFLMSKNGSGKKESFAKKLLNPNTISFGIAILMFFFRIKLPPVVNEAASSVGGLTTALSMIFIGMTLATIDVKKTMKKWWIFVIAPLKLVIMPIVFLYLFKAFGIPEIILGVVVLEAAMPAQTVLTILAHEHGADYEYTAVGLFMTTVASLVTLPFVCWLLQNLL
ncbi:MAG: AEC family transporter [Ruminococcaceae bacterium]|nr:AEC family transporter [Oscillospiraceae bacterium]